MDNRYSIVYSFGVGYLRYEKSFGFLFQAEAEAYRFFIEMLRTSMNINVYPMVIVKVHDNEKVRVVCEYEYRKYNHDL